MSNREYQLLLLYNDDSQVRHGSPQDLLAVQSTVETAHQLYDALASLERMSPDEVREHRYQRYRHLGSFIA